MKTMLKTLKWALGVVLFAAIFSSLANAQCMSLSMSKRAVSLLKPQSLSHMTSPAAFAPVAEGATEDLNEPPDPMVGMWYVTFTDDAENYFDWGYSQFHSDGTEILNSGTGPGKFCLGVWKRTGKLKYKLNHLPIPYNGTDLLGIIQIIENITVSGDHNHFTGRFTMGLYDSTTGEIMGDLVSGSLDGHRITVNTPVTDVLPTPAPY